MLNLTVEFAIAQGRQRRILEEKVGLVASGREVLSPIRIGSVVSRVTRTGDEDSHGPGRADVFTASLAAFETLPERAENWRALLVVGEDVEVDTTILEHIHGPAHAHDPEFPWITV